MCNHLMSVHNNKIGIDPKLLTRKSGDDIIQTAALDWIAIR